MKRAQFFSKLEELLEEAPGTIKADVQLADLASWDSLAVMGFIAMMDAELGAAPAAKAITACKSVGDLMKLAGDRIED